MRNFVLRGMAVAGTATAIVLATDSYAQAFGHRWAASCGSWGGYATSASHGSWGGSWGNAGSWGSTGSWGGGHHRVGLLRRIFHRHASHGSWGGSHGSHGGRVAYYSGSHGSWGGSHGGSWGGSHGGSYGGSYGGTMVAPADGDGAEMMLEGTETPPPPMPQTDDSTFRRIDDSALLTVAVPADAKVFVNENLTSSTGELRRYVSRGLQPGAAYTYRVRAEFTRDGETVSETQSVRLTAGGAATLAFQEPMPEIPVAHAPAETKLTIHVPADAKVFLAGNPTQQTGSARQFITTQLAQGQTWSNYVVRVEAERNGQVVSDERSIQLSGGDSQELVMDLDAPKIAAR